LNNPRADTNAIRAKPQHLKDKGGKQNQKFVRHFAKAEPKLTQTSTRGKPTHACASCGRTDHWRNDCRFKDVTCNKCKKKGHIAKVCRSTYTANSISIVQKPVKSFFTINNQGEWWKVNVNINGSSHRMNVDTGAQATLSRHNYGISLENQHCFPPILKP
uniref:CCHC-type domain-containing protein n=1 Tax=Meloidogyne floridensis TaxID=298350 RepID=A0A915PA01_9BILA